MGEYLGGCGDLRFELPQCGQVSVARVYSPQAHLRNRFGMKDHLVPRIGILQSLEDYFTLIFLHRGLDGFLDFLVQSFGC